MVVNIADTVDLDFIDTDGISYAVYFQGCKKRCKNCHNPELQPFEGGEAQEIDSILCEIRKNIEWYDSVVFMGGEPLEQKSALKELLKEIRDMGLETWLYTGYKEEEVPLDIQEICSVIVSGEYMDELKTGGFPASSNQRITDRRNKSAV